MNIKSILEDLSKQVDEIKQSVLTKENIWIQLNPKLKNTVVQLISIHNYFNWSNPNELKLGNQSRGSGFFIDNRGTIVSNYHVVQQSISQHVLIPSFGKKKFLVNIIGVSPERDIALLRLTKQSLNDVGGKTNYLIFGDSDKVKRFQSTVALGFPLGQDKLKATQGSVSGRQRLGYFGYIQIDTPINPGNSGGPSINTKGEVIGINSRGVIGADNIGYIIPINEVVEALKSLERYKLIRKPGLGAVFMEPTEEMFEFYGMPNKKNGGWFIAKLFKTSILKKYGIEERDFLYKINGHFIDSHGEINVDWSEDKISLFELLNRYAVGQTLKITVFRYGKKIEVEVPFKEEPRPIRMVYPEFEKEETRYFNFGGMILMNLKLNHILAFKKGIPFNLMKFSRYENQGVGAVLITTVFPTSISSKVACLSAGVVVKKLNGKRIKSLSDFITALNDSKSDGFVKILTKDGFFCVLSLKKILKEESKLVDLYNYKQMIFPSTTNVFVIKN
jgi:serine protease Do